MSDHQPPPTLAYATRGLRGPSTGIVSEVVLTCATVLMFAFPWFVAGGSEGPVGVFMFYAAVTLQIAAWLGVGLTVLALVTPAPWRYRVMLLGCAVLVVGHAMFVLASEVAWVTLVTGMPFVVCVAGLAWHARWRSRRR